MAGKVYVFHGEEFSAREALERLRAGLGPPDALASNTSLFDGRQLSYGQLEMTCNTVPFLADCRLVVVEGLLDRFEERPGRRQDRGASGGGDAQPAPWAGLASMVQAMPPTTVVVFLAGSLSTRNPLFAQLQAVAEVREFPLLRGARLHAWIGERVARHGGQIAPGALHLLANYSGGNLRQLDSELQKLCLYAGARPVQEDDVRLLVSDTREASIFALVDALIEGRRAEALWALRSLMDQGATGTYIIPMLARQLRMMVQVRSLQSQRASQAEMARALGTGSDFVLRKARGQALAYTEERLKGLYRRLLDADVAIKTGAFSEELALETLVAEAAGQ